jgi:Rhodopirellula transposase DDE domain
VAVGTNHDTSAVAVNTIVSWWYCTGRPAYPAASRLLITCDGGGSNGYRTRAWKTETARSLSTASAPSTLQRAPVMSMRSATRCRQAPSMIPVAMGQPEARAVG